MAENIQLRRPTSRTYSIPELVGSAQRGELRIPTFQRSFVWEAADIRKLFDSIWRGFPIGTLLLWQRKADAERVSLGPVDVDAPAFTNALWVVDGQQRVTSLVGALTTTAARCDERFELCFDLRRRNFVQAGRRPLPAYWLPVRDALETTSLMAWTRNYGVGLAEEEIKQADALSGALREYLVPAYVVDHDDEDTLRDVFDRVNSAGKRISRAQIFHALFGAVGEAGSAPGVAESLRRRGFGRFDDQQIVQSLLAIRGGDVNRDLHNEFAPNEDRALAFDDTERALGRVVAYLREQGVPHLQLLPAALPVPVLAAFFHLHPDPHPSNLHLLSRWLWRGWVHGYGRAGTTPALRRAVQAVHPRKGNPQDAPGEFDAAGALLDLVVDEPMPKIDTRALRTDSTFGRLQLLALASLRPLGSDGAPLDLSAAFEEPGGGAVTELVRGHRTEFAARGFWPTDAPRLTGSEPPEILTSHAISTNAAVALAADDVPGFLEWRNRELADLVRRYLATRLDHDALVRPPLEDLVVADEAWDATG